MSVFRSCLTPKTHVALQGLYRLLPCTNTIITVILIYEVGWIHRAIALGPSSTAEKKESVITVVDLPACRATHPRFCSHANCFISYNLVTLVCDRRARIGPSPKNANPTMAGVEPRRPFTSEGTGGDKNQQSTHALQ